MTRLAPLIGLLLLATAVPAPAAADEQRRGPADTGRLARRSGRRGDRRLQARHGIPGPARLGPLPRRLDADLGQLRRRAIESVDVFDLDARQRIDSVPARALKAPGEVTFY